LSCIHKSLIESYQTIRAINQTVISIDEGALNISIFLQTKETNTLKNIPENITNAELNFEKLQQLLDDDPETAQENLLEKLTPLLQIKISFWKKVLSEYSTKNVENLFNIASDKNSLTLTQNIKDDLIGIKKIEIKQLNIKEYYYNVDKIGIKKILIFVGLLCAFFFICSFTLLYKYLKEY
jgi:CHASE3 domain sensor protein